MPKKTKIIMTVDDDTEILKLIENIFKQEGYDVIKLISGGRALEKLEEIKPDLILIDFYMAGMDGLDLAEKIRANKKMKDVKMVFLTVATFSKKGMDRLEELNVSDYIQKPFKYKELVERVKKIIE